MTIETWLAFAAASSVLLVIPGPTILLVVSYALGRGMRTALPVAAGVALGDFTAMTLSMLGLGALLATSALLFTALKWLGAAEKAWLDQVLAERDERTAYQRIQATRPQTLGVALPWGIAASIVRPSEKVLSISGDGGFMYNVQELSTAVKHGIDVVAIVFADGAYGNVRRMQKEDYGNRLSGVDLHNPNFPKMAESFDAAGVRTTTPDGLRREWGRTLAGRGTFDFRVWRWVNLICWAERFDVSFG